MEELPEEWKESLFVPTNKKGDKTDCSNYRGISLLSTTYNILSNIVLSSFDVLLTVHLSIILVINQLNAQNLVL